MDSACPHEPFDYVTSTAVDCDLRRWPNSAFSRFVSAGGLVWHVQEWGSGPAVLLLHGTGASTHSWRDVAPLLAARFRVVVPDLPGHGYTSSPEFVGFTVAAMATSLRELLRALDANPCMVVGHSAGAAILARMALDGHIAPRVLASINGALLPLSGFPRWLFAPLAKVMVRSAWVPHLVARRATRAAVKRVIDGTGSYIDSFGIELYRQLVRRPRHVSAALSMMANWDLQTLARDLPRLQAPLRLLTAAGDLTIPPTDAARVRELVPDARLVSLGGLGHLAHEERPREVAGLLLQLAVAAGVLLPQVLE